MGDEKKLNNNLIYETPLEIQDRSCKNNGYVTKMNITVITSNQNRHNFLINKLSNICEKLYAIQEKKFLIKIFQYYSQSKIIEEYFIKLNEPNKKILASAQ